MLIIALLLNSARFFSRPETEILNKTLNVVLKTQELPLVSGVATQKDNSSSLYQTSAILVKNGVNFSHQIYTRLQKANNPREFIAQQSRDIALGKTELWEQRLDSQSLTAEYGPKIERPILLKKLKSGLGSALEYSKLITSPKDIFEQLETDIDTKGKAFNRSELKLVCHQNLKTLPGNIYQISGQQKLTFALLVDEGLSDQDIALFLANIPEQNEKHLATLIIPNNNKSSKISIPEQITQGRIEPIAYNVPENTFLTRISITDSSGNQQFLAREILPDQQKTIPFFWDGTKNGQKLPAGKYKVTISHLDQNKQTIDSLSAIIRLQKRSSRESSEAYYTIPETKGITGKREFSILLSNVLSGAFKLSLRKISNAARDNNLEQEAMLFTFSNPSNKHSSLYYDEPSIILSLKDNDNRPIPEAFVKIIGDQGFQSSWLKTNNNGLASCRYSAQQKRSENIFAYVDLVQINQAPLVIDGQK